ncbi:glycerophosphodiester phosphodiesterase [Brevibacillus composti]|uniref:Glycerophosphodiester phosphodiesterase n=1 Tax=Brevibacillus composti TaxID=2796470 RepID=A0A7T5EMY0_9BACL|nr:glycerophosphodiester phosphodiesterase family protein [Brevibacillus composti]QQE75521.1 glycerophosphodiester phosphodiesterase [Brevibacillus composti]QUO42547.1 glycerophosphodiester phosphodiesterase [Brevibacillus composti]
MGKRRKIGKKRLFSLLFLLLITFIYVNNSHLFIKGEAKAPWLLAHRGLAQTYGMEGITGETCTAERIYEPEHPYLENTIPSMLAAFEAGADVVEFDIQPTKDGKFAVFHDWTLDCRTDGKGVTREHTWEELKRLDVGYGYTADQGKSYPFRGKGKGMMPSLDEVLSRFPDKDFLIHIKSNDPREGEELAAFLSAIPANQISRLTVYGGDEPIRTLQERMPALRVMSKASMKSCLLPYIAVGWTGYVPSACAHTQLHIPEKIGPWLWGWPHHFVQRMEQADTRVIVVGGDGSDFSSGFDAPEDLDRLPASYSGGIWTNRIDRIAPLVPRSISHSH